MVSTDPSSSVDPFDSDTLCVVQAVLREFCECCGDITPQSRLVDDLELESVMLLTLVAELENHYRTALDITDYAEIQTVQDVVEAINSHLNRQA